MDDRLKGQIAGEKERAEIAKEIRFLWVLWATNLLMLLVLVFMCHIFKEKAERIKVSEDFPLGILKIVLAIVGVFSLALAQLLRKRFLAGKYKFYDTLCIRNAASMNKPVYLMKYRTNIYLFMMMPGIIGMFGFLLFLLGSGLETFYVFVIVSALGIIWQRPRTEELIEFFQREKEKSKANL